MKSIGITIACGFSVLAVAQAAVAQVVPDNTVGTTVSPTNLIDGGMRSGNNLFHSFSQFSIPTGSGAIFNNPVDIQNIFSRVTGNTQSSIDGLIKAQGNANLFLMNPNGILFGPNAKLDIGGSFIGTTANTIKFADGVQFSTNDVNPNPLLTVTIPIGLQMGSNPGPIQIQGDGHTLTAPNPVFAPYISTAPNSGLAVSSEQSLVLVGGSIILEGGLLSAPSGRIELGSVKQGMVSLIDSVRSLNYTSAIQFGDVQFKQRSIVDVNDINGGSIQVQARNISLSDGSVLWVQNRGLGTAGSIQINATESLILKGSTSDGQIATSIRNETVSPGTGGNLQVTAPTIQILDGASLSNKTFTEAPGGQLRINATNLNVQGYQPQFPEIFSSIGTITTGPGNAGNITIGSQNITVRSGGFIGSATLIENGRAGNVNIQSDTITVSGTTSQLISSTIGSSSLGLGNSGDLMINTRTLNLSNSGLVSTSSIARGSGGSLLINASDSIDINGKHELGAYESGISSAVSFPSPAYAQIFGLTGVPIGSSGNVTINTNRLQVSNAGSIGTTNEGIGDAGTITIVANSIVLNQDVSITAYTETGNGGNVNIDAQSLILRNGSEITATASGIVGELGGNSGNISIHSSIIVGLNNSDILANARNGFGGIINIITQGLIGLKYRPLTTPDSDITASSDVGLNGMVQINSLELDRHLNFPTLAEEIIDSSQLISKGCSDRSNSNFIITGHGGLPSRLLGMSGIDRTWGDVRPITTTIATQPITQIQNPKSKIVEASQIQISADGTIALVDGIATIVNQSAETCAVSTMSELPR